MVWRKAHDKELRPFKEIKERINNIIKMNLHLKRHGLKFVIIFGWFSLYGKALSIIK